MALMNDRVAVLQRANESGQSSITGAIELISALLLGACIGLFATSARAAPDTVTVFAAASLNDAMTVIGDRFGALHDVKVQIDPAASGTLAKQIEQGAPAAVFISADEQWMDRLESAGLIDQSSRVDLLGNRLVLVAPRGKGQPVVLQKGVDLLSRLGGGRLAIGEPASVPAGKYAQSALIRLGVWDSVKDHLAASDSVRSALALVAHGEAPLGIVYASDAAIEPQVEVVATFANDDAAPIRYPAALIKANRSASATAFLLYLRSDQAAAVFARFGFIVLH
jgi:molybdate transport system substrate-binding protein